MIKKLPPPPCLSVCTCLLSGTRPSKGLNPESVNSYKHTPMYMSTYTHTLIQLYVLKAHTHSHAYHRSFDIIHWLGWTLTKGFIQICTSQLNYCGTCSTGACGGSAGTMSNCDSPFQKKVVQAIQAPEKMCLGCFILPPTSSNGHAGK